MVDVSLWISGNPFPNMISTTSPMSNKLRDKRRYRAEGRKYEIERSVTASWCDMIVEKPTLAFYRGCNWNYLNIRFFRSLLVFTSYDGKREEKRSEQSRSIHGIVKFSLVQLSISFAWGFSNDYDRSLLPEFRHILIFCILTFQHYS